MWGGFYTVAISPCGAGGLILGDTEGGPALIFIVWQTTTTNSIGQNTEKAYVIQVIHVASLDHA
jgi:hypothetical protein